MNLDRAKQLAEQIMIELALTKDGWRFEYDQALVRFGSCNCTEKLITLSAPLVELNSEEEVRDTILHEIAHAATPRHGHDKTWKRVAVSIGCTGKRCYNTDKVIQPKRRWTGTCTGCGRTIQRNIRKKCLYHILCGSKEKYIWRRNK